MYSPEMQQTPLRSVGWSCAAWAAAPVLDGFGWAREAGTAVAPV